MIGVGFREKADEAYSTMLNNSQTLRNTVIVQTMGGEISCFTTNVGFLGLKNHL